MLSHGTILEHVWKTESGLLASIKTHYYNQTDRQRFHRCGYVKVSKEHPLYDLPWGDKRIYSFNVHGGITYSEQEGIFWVFGFDCAHGEDAQFCGDKGKYWTFSELITECEKLADQLAKLA